MFGSTCGVAVWLLLILLALMVLGFFVSFGGHLDFNFLPYVDISLGRGA